jgi:hypothetical protein
MQPGRPTTQGVYANLPGGLSDGPRIRLGRGAPGLVAHVVIVLLYVTSRRGFVD